MAKHVVTVCPGGGQMRVTIPKLLLRELDWTDVRHVLLESNQDGTLTVRRFVDGESLKTSRKTGKDGPD